MKEHVYSVWVIARPSKDIEGQWVGHCLEFDVISQGDSLDHAIRMVLEATRMVVVDDLQKHRDPRQRRAPEDYFETLSRVISSGQKVPLDLDSPTKVASASIRSPSALRSRPSPSCRRRRSRSRSPFRRTSRSPSRSRAELNACSTSRSRSGDRGAGRQSGEAHQGLSLEGLRTRRTDVPAAFSQRAARELDDEYIRGLARLFGITFNDMMKRVRS